MLRDTAYGTAENKGGLHLPEDGAQQPPAHEIRVSCCHGAAVNDQMQLEWCWSGPASWLKAVRRLFHFQSDARA